MQIFDTHCHYNLSPLYENWEQHWAKAQDNGVVGALIPSADLETSRRALEIAKSDENLWAGIGFHPNHYNQISAADLPTKILQDATNLRMLLESDQKNTTKQKPQQIVAIGETGLDYYRLKTEEREKAIQNQQAALKMHLQLANEFEKILIIHTRDKGGKKDKNNQAYWDVLEIIKNNYEFKRPVILHCLSGPKDYIKEAIKLGAYFGVGGNVTYKNADELRELVAMLSEDKVLLETDAPYLPPQEFRGQTCEPWMISKTAEYMEHELGKTSARLDLKKYLLSSNRL